MLNDNYVRSRKRQSRVKLSAGKGALLYNVLLTSFSELFNQNIWSFN